MALSEQERAALDELEQLLLDSDPGFAERMRPKTHAPWAPIVGVLGATGGMVMLVWATAAAQTWLGVAGYLLALLAVVLPRELGVRAVTDLVGTDPAPTQS